MRRLDCLLLFTVVSDSQELHVFLSPLNSLLLPTVRLFDDPASCFTGRRMTFDVGGR